MYIPNQTISDHGNNSGWMEDPIVYIVDIGVHFERVDLEMKQD
jgi:hypothetical protein